MVLILTFQDVLQKLLKYFNGTAISSFFVLPSAGVLLAILIFGLTS